MLKRVEILGFKSFGAKVAIDFDSEVTAIVGPNGSGKSNIVDAICWALGEQKVKPLRGSKMEDVLYSGSTGKRPVGLAQVSLFIDNTNRILDVDLDEVVVTRKLYRSGESEYIINKRQCRLKDILELFMDTGIGREGYSIIGQGQIDSIVMATPLERRRIIEEAVGIVKHKSRKREAEKRLDATKLNMDRLYDIASEVDMRLPSLYAQAQAALEHQSLSSQLASCESRLLAFQIHEYAAKEASLKESMSKANSQLEAFDARISSIEGEIANIAQKSKVFDTEELAINVEILGIVERSSRIEARLGLQAERISQLKDRTNELQDTKIALEAQLAEFASQLGRSLSEEELAKASLDKAKAEFEYASGRHSRIEQLKSEYDLAHHEILAASQKIAAEKEDLSAKHMHASLAVAGIEADIARIETELSMLQGKLVHVVDSSYKEAQDSFAARSSELGQARKELEDRKRTLSTLDGAISDAMSKISYNASRYDALKGYEESFGAYKNAVQKIGQAMKKDPSLAIAIAGPVGEVIKVKDIYNTAISRALGASIENIIVDTEHTAKRLIKMLKKNKWGRITFYPMNIIRGRAYDFSRCADMPGYIGSAAGLVECEAKYRHIVDSLLARTLVVDNLDNANNIAKRMNHQFRIATLEGEVLFPGGAIVGGASAGVDTGALARRSEIDKLSGILASQRLAYSKMAAKRSGLAFELEGAESSLQLAIERASQARSECDSLQAACQEQTFQAQLSLARQAELDSQMAAQKAQKTSLETLMEGYLFAIDTASRAVAQNEAKLSGYNSRQAQGEDAMESLDLKGKAEIALLKAQSRLESAQNETKLLYSQIFKAESALSSAIASIAQFAQDMEKLEYGEQEMASQLEVEKDHSREVEGKRSRLLELKAGQSALSAKMSADLADESKKRTALSERIYKIGSDIKNIAFSKSSCEESLMSNYALSYEGLVQSIQEQGKMGEFEALDQKSESKRAKSLRSQIAGLGLVNLAAVREHEELQARKDAMDKQLDDMRASMEDLAQIIKDLADAMAKAFRENFEAINREFQEAFTKMFNGGSASLILQESDEGMPKGIEIIAKPAKTNIKNVAALSGGEKAMCAIALVMAIIKIKPAPFCLLDEIDAALDESNVERFCDYICGAKGNNQFLIVTHKRKTIEAANVLCGVSMGADGSSSLVSLKLSDVESRGFAYA
ncbi:MAG: chromosome segregation protein SMC [Eubacteriaceae bacterium]|nr:chromosome segregation protein SMC [Eubacteriaceae bacterium]